MKKILAFAFMLISFANFGQNIDATLNAFYDATGGKTKWDSVKNYTLVQSFVANAPTDYDMEVNVLIAEKSLSRRKSIMKRDFFYVVKDNNGWLKIPMGSLDKNVKYTIKDLSDKEKNTIQREINDGVLPFLNYGQKGFTATFGTEEQVAGKTAQKITLKRDALTLDLFFDKTSGRVVKEIYTTPELTETWEHTAFATNANGLTYPSSSTYINSKDKKLTKVTTKLEVNKSINSALFVKE